MSTFTNDTFDEVYLPTLGVWLKAGESVDYLADGEEPPAAEPVKPSKVKAVDTPKTDPAPEPADTPTSPADTQES